MLPHQPSLTTRLLITSALLILLAALAYPLQYLTFSNEQWLSHDNPHKQNKAYINDTFSKGEELIVLIKLEGTFFSKALLDELHAIYEKLIDHPHIVAINSPWHAQAMLKDEEDTLHVTSWRESVESGILPSLHAYRQALAKTHYWDQLISHDASYFILQVTADINFHGSNNDKIRSSIVQSIQPLLAESKHFRHFQITGESGFIFQLDSMSKDALKIFLPIILVMLFCALYLLMGSLPLTIIIMLSGIFTLFAAFNVMVFFGHHINAATLSLPTLIVAIAIADAIHIIHDNNHRLALYPDLTRLEALKATLKMMWKPCLLTTLTTGIGFGTFYFSEIVPLQHFGTDSLAALLLAYPLILLGVSTMLYIAPHFSFARFKEPSLPAFVTQLVQYFSQKNIPLPWILICIFTLLFYLLLPLNTNSNFLEIFFKDKHPIVEANHIIDTKFSGSGNIEIIFKTDTVDFFKSIEQFTAIRDFEQNLLDLPTIQRVISYLTPISMVHQTFDTTSPLPDTQSELSQEILLLEWSRNDQKNDILQQYSTFQYDSIRLQSFTPKLSAYEIDNLIENIKAIDIPFASNIQIIFGGVQHYFKIMNHYILDTQIVSFMLCVFLITLLFIQQFGFRYGLAGMLVNITPILITLAIINVSGIPFDFSIVLVASVALGLGVDHTIHALYRYKLLKQSAAPPSDPSVAALPAIYSTIQEIWRPVMISSLLLIFVFLILCASDLVTMIHFGFFSSVAIFLELISVITLLPALLKYLDTK